MAEMIDLSKLPHDEAVKKAMELFGFALSDAENYIAFVTGEIDGDVLMVGSDEMPEESA